MDAPERKKLSWGAEQRLEFVEFKLFWDGEINRSDITERFGVSVPQASGDLALYREMAPANIEYDTSAKRYSATPDFRPRLITPNPDRYLAQLRAISDGIVELSDTWITDLPSTGTLPTPGRRIDAAILRMLLTSVRTGSSIHIKYQSMSADKPDPLWRWISPHAFAFDGLRWHVRAFCHRNNGFIDFLVGRCLDVGAVGAPGARAEDDWQWQTRFTVVFQPNPDLTEGQRRAIALDYEMKADQVGVPVRYALLYYFNKRLRLDVGATHDRPSERPVVVANRDEFTEALAKATQFPGPVISPSSGS